jgi:hypothetical protein
MAVPVIPHPYGVEFVDLGFRQPIDPSVKREAIPSGYPVEKLDWLYRASLLEHRRAHAAIGGRLLLQ